MTAEGSRSTMKFRNPVVSPASLVHHATIYDAGAAVAQSHDLEAHPYFHWMLKPETTRQAFMLSQLPFRYNIDAFAQCLAAVLARIPDIKRRLATVFDNVKEEHGHGNYHRTHPATFETFLRSIGASEEDLAVPSPTPAVMMMEFCLSYCLANPPEHGAALLGMVELTYVKVSTMIANTIAARQWGDIDAQNHYRVHEELDVSHSHDLLLVAADTWEKSPHQREALAHSLLVGANFVWTVYHDMHPIESGFTQEEKTAARRNFRRRQVIAPCHIVIGDKLISGQLRDASESGICMDVAEMVVSNSKVDVRISNPKTLADITVRGLVHWCTKDDGQSQAKLGLELIGSEGQMADWKALLHSLTAPKTTS